MARLTVLSCLPQVDIGRAYTAIQRQLDQYVDAIHPADYVRRFCSQLGMSAQDMKVRRCTECFWICGVSAALCQWQKAAAGVRECSDMPPLQS